MKNILMDLLDLILEQANKRRDVESEITNLSRPLTVHLIKILKWDDKQNFNKHCADIETWITDIYELKIKDNKFPKQKDYFQWMFLDVAQDQNMVSKRIRSLRDYHLLPVKRTDEEVFAELKRIFLELSVDLASRNLKDIEEYLK